MPRTGSPKFKIEFDLGAGVLGYVLLSVSNFLFFIFFMYKLMKTKLMNLCIRVIMQLKQMMLKQFYKHSLNLSKDFLKVFCISKADYFRSIQN